MLWTFLFVPQVRKVWESKRELLLTSGDGRGAAHKTTGDGHLMTRSARRSSTSSTASTSGGSNSFGAPWGNGSECTAGGQF